MDKLQLTQEHGFYITIFCWILIRAIMLLFKTGKKEEFGRGVLIHAFAIYICFVISKVFFPMTLQLSGVAQVTPPELMFNPLTSYMRVVQGNGINFAIEHMVGNMFLLTPMAFFLMVLYHDNFDGIMKVILISLIVSFAIESLQFVESYMIPGVSRSIDINDLIFNTISGLWGFIAYKVFVIASKIFAWMKKSLVL